MQPGSQESTELQQYIVDEKHHFYLANPKECELARDMLEFSAGNRVSCDTIIARLSECTKVFREIRKHRSGGTAQYLPVHTVFMG